MRGFLIDWPNEASPKADWQRLLRSLQSIPESDPDKAAVLAEARARAAEAERMQREAGLTRD